MSELDEMWLNYEATKSELEVVLTVLANVVKGATNLSQAENFIRLNFPKLATEML